METAARVLISDSLGFHILFVMFGVALPLMISIFEFIAIKTHNEALREQVRRWTLAMIILAIAGVVSGTLIAVQFSLIWPQFMAFTSQVVGPAFMFEGYFFLIEAVFLAFYVASWNKIKGYRHWLISLGVFVGAVGSAIVITLVNAWMNNPVGFDMINGVISNVSISTALFTRTGLNTVVHSVLSYFTVVSLAMAALYAVAMRRQSKKATAQLYENLSYSLAWIGVVFISLTMLWGHATAQYLATSNPQKLAAYELQMPTETNAPLRIGGTYNDETERVEGAIELPGMLSFLAGNSANTEVQGLDASPQNTWPPLVVHELFDLKMLLAIIALAIPMAVLLSRWSRVRRYAAWVRGVSFRSLPIAALSAFAVVELGWIMAELGRQPYAIRGYLLTSEAFTRDHSTVQLGIIFPILFVLLLITTIMSLVIALKRAPRTKGVS